MRYGFVTCVQLGLSCLEELVNLDQQPRLLLTLPDNVAPAKSGRVFLDCFASDHEVPLLKVRNINDSAALEAISREDLDWLFIIGWSQIAKPDLLRIPRRGVVGIHPTLLPTGRGRASIPWAIIKGLPRTGVSMFKLDEGVDTGPIIAQLEIPIADDETATTLYERVNDAHRELIRRGVPRLVDPGFEPIAQQSENATEWPGRVPADGQITPEMSVECALRLVRATTRPYPGAFVDRAGQRYRIWSATTDGPTASPLLPVRLSDGTIFATDFDVEEIPA